MKYTEYELRDATILLKLTPSIINQENPITSLFSGKWHENSDILY